MRVAVPLINQLAITTEDGRPPEDARAQCVAAAIAGGVRGLLPAIRHTADWYKDAAYGDGYVGATDPLRYFGVLSRLGVVAVNVTGTADMLVATVASELVRGHPVLGAIPSLWGRYTAATLPDGGSTHEVCFCDVFVGGDGVTYLTAMNPWPEPPTNDAFYQTAPLAWWRERIVYGRVDPLRLAADGKGGGNVATGSAVYTVNADGTVTFPGNGKNAASVHLLGGMSSELLGRGAPQVGDVPRGPEYYVGSDLAVLEWQSGQVWTWRHTRPSVNRLGGVEVIAALRGELAAATPAAASPSSAPSAMDQAAVSAVHALAAAIALSQTQPQAK